MGVGARFGVLLRATPSLHFSGSVDMVGARDIRPFGHKSTTFLFGFGAIVGSIDRPGRFYISGAAGHTVTEIKAGEYKVLGVNISSADGEQSASGEGFGYRVSIGRTITREARWEVSYLNLDARNQFSEDVASAGVQSVMLNIAVGGNFNGR